MRHYGDITKIHGDAVPAVDIICGGSPCQDLSIAGGRAGLSGERSGLFMDQIRIIKEMRKNAGSDRRTDDAIPGRFLVWENVPGATNSNSGRDFQSVLTEVIRVAVPSAPVVPMPDDGKWPNAGLIYDELRRISVSWRVHDSQFWGKTIVDIRTGAILKMGTPQRRRRIALVADYGGMSAGDVLFERRGLCRDDEESGETRQDVAGLAAYGADNSVAYDGTQITSPLHSENPRFGDPCYTLHSGTQNLLVSIENHPNDSRLTIIKDGTVQTLSGRIGTGGNNAPLICERRILASATSQANAEILDGVAPTMVAAAGTGGNNTPLLTDEQTLTIRRITPKEAERLQGYPDGWTDIGEWIDSKGKKRKSSTASRFKALGNSLCLPFWEWMAWRIVDQYPEDRRSELTMASLFDGIGGFPLVFQRAGVRPVWASEIEEFPIAVTKYRFPEAEE